MSVLRVAIVQIDYNAAMFLEFNHLFEPDDFSNLSHAPTLHRSTAKTEYVKSIKVNIQKRVYQDYTQWFEKRLIKILDTCIDKKVQLVVFPEFSIPSSCLDTVRKKSLQNMTIVAGTHTFLPSQKQQYLNLGIEIPTPNAPNGICPVCFPDGTWKVILKTNLTRWDSLPIYGQHLKIADGNLAQSISLKANGIEDKYFVVLICFDFLKNIGSDGIDDNLKNATFYVVPACSFETETFDKMASFSARRLHKPTFFVNTALMGGSTIFSNFENIDINPFFSQDRTYSIPQGDECIVISDVDLETLAIERPTSLSWKSPTELHAIIPFVYDNYSEDHATSYSAFLKKIEKADHEDMRNLVEFYLFRDRIAERLKSKVLHYKLNELNHSKRFRDYSPEYLKWLLEALVFPPSFPSPQEWRFIEFYHCIQQIKKVFLNDSSLNDYSVWSELQLHYEKRQKEILSAHEIREFYYQYSEENRLSYGKIFSLIIEAGHKPSNVKNQIKEIESSTGFRKDVAACIIAERLGINIEGVLPIEKSRK